MNDTKEISLLVEDIYQSNKTVLTQLLEQMQPKDTANIDTVNALVETIRQNNEAFQIAARLAIYVNNGFVKVKAELIVQLNSKQDWVNKMPQYLPQKLYSGEEFLFIDSNGNIAAMGEDFSAAEKQGTYPISVYRTQRISYAKTTLVEAGI